MIKSVRFISKQQGKALGLNWKLGLLAQNAGDQGDGRILYVNYRGLLTWPLALMLVVGYLSAAFAVLMALQFQRFCYVSYTDILFYPWRDEKVQTEMARARIDEGIDDYKHGHPGEGFVKIRNGLFRFPSHNMGRLILAQSYLRIGDVDTTKKLLRDGLPYLDGDPNYIQALVSLAQKTDDNDFLLKTSSLILDQYPKLVSDTERKQLWIRRVQALSAKDEYDQAIQILEHDVDPLDPTFRELKVLTLLDASRPRDALVELQAWQQDSNADKGGFPLRLLVRAYRELGDFNDMQHVLKKMIQAEPNSLEVRTYSVVQNYLAGQTQQSAAELAAILKNLDESSETLEYIASPLSRIGAIDLLDNLCSQEKTTGMMNQSLAVYRIEALITCSRFADARKDLLQLKAQTTNPTLDQTDAIKLTELLLNVAENPSKNASQQLLDNVRTIKVTLPVLVRLIGVLENAKKTEVADQLLDYGKAQFPNSDLLRKKIVEFESRRRRADVVSQTSIANKTPASDDTDVNQEPDWSSKPRFDARLVALMDKADYAGAAELFGDLYLAKPRWYQAFSEEVHKKEVELHLKSGNKPALSAALRRYINGSLDRYNELKEIALFEKQAGRLDNATLIMREIQRSSYGPTFADKYLADWSAPAEAVSTKPEVSTAPSLVKPVEPDLEVPSQPVQTSELTSEMSASYEAFSEQIGQCLENKNYERGLRLIKALRLENPAWLASSASEVGCDEVKLQIGKGDPLLLVLVTRQYLNGDIDRASRMIDLAIEQHDAGHGATALVLIREVKRKHPEFNRPAELLAEWSAP